MEFIPLRQLEGWHDQAVKQVEEACLREEEVRYRDATVSMDASPVSEGEWITVRYGTLLPFPLPPSETEKL